jgi:hypothetical protein
LIDHPEYQQKCPTTVGRYSAGFFVRQIVFCRVSIDGKEFTPAWTRNKERLSNHGVSICAFRPLYQKNGTLHFISALFGF